MGGGARRTDGVLVDDPLDLSLGGSSGSHGCSEESFEDGGNCGDKTAVLTYTAGTEVE